MGCSLGEWLMRGATLWAERSWSFAATRRGQHLRKQGHRAAPRLCAPMPKDGSCSPTCRRALIGSMLQRRVGCLVLLAADGLVDRHFLSCWLKRNIAMI